MNRNLNRRRLQGQTLPEIDAALAATRRTGFFSSFLADVELAPDTFRRIIQTRGHSISFSSDFVHRIIHAQNQPLEEEDELPIDPNQAPMEPAMFTNFYRAMNLSQHSQHCRLLQTFKQNFCQTPELRPPPAGLMYQLIDKIRDGGNANLELLSWFQETEIGRARLAEFARLKNPATAALLAQKLFGCVLVLAKRLSLKTAAAVAKLSLSQIKHALRDFHSGKLVRPHTDHRGDHKKRTAKVTEEIKEFVQGWVRQRKSAFTLYDLREEVATAFPGISLSRMTLHRLLKARLGFTFRSAIPYPPARNSPEVKHQRFWFAHKTLHLWEENRMIIAIDECGFSGYHTRRRAWLHPELMPASDTGLFRNSPNVSLLLAVSHDAVLGYFLKEGPINNFIFAEFMLQLDRRIRESWNPTLPPVYILDNAQAHKGAFLKGLFMTTKMQVIYLPPYSPELNWIEFVFGILKQRLDKTGLPKGKSTKKIRDHGYN